MRYILILLVLSVSFFSCKRNKNSKNTVNVAPTQKSKKPKSNKTVTPNSNDNSKADAAVKEARSYIGTPYKYGGNTRSGIDCSGLTCASLKAAGVALPRTANDQSTFGTTVSTSNIQKGDLVFFTDRKGNTKITHVGMVTDVKGPGQVKFIHASTKAGVVENDLFSDYYKNLFLKAVRVLK
jgi:cell wall-associated NlpC family hydrolase